METETNDEEVTMDELIQYIMDEGKEIGREEGKAEGKEEGKKEGQMDVIRWMMENPGSTPEQAMRMFGF